MSFPNKGPSEHRTVTLYKALLSMKHCYCTKKPVMKMSVSVKFSSLQMMCTRLKSGKNEPKSVKQTAKPAKNSFKMCR